MKYKTHYRKGMTEKEERDTYFQRQTERLAKRKSNYGPLQTANTDFTKLHNGYKGVATRRVI